MKLWVEKINRCIKTTNLKVFSFKACPYSKKIITAAKMETEMVYLIILHSHNVHYVQLVNEFGPKCKFKLTEIRELR